MQRRERLAWMLILLVPVRLARWLVFDKLGQQFPLPKSWVPYLFGRALEVDGRSCSIKPTSVDDLPAAKLADAA